MKAESEKEAKHNAQEEQKLKDENEKLSRDKKALETQANTLYQDKAKFEMA